MHRRVREAVAATVPLLSPFLMLKPIHARRQACSSWTRSSSDADSGCSSIRAKLAIILLIRRGNFLAIYRIPIGGTSDSHGILEQASPNRPAMVVVNRPYRLGVDLGRWGRESARGIGDLQNPDPGLGAKPPQVAVAGDDKARAAATAHSSKRLSSGSASTTSSRSLAGSRLSFLEKPPGRAGKNQPGNLDVVSAVTSITWPPCRRSWRVPRGGHRQFPRCGCVPSPAAPAASVSAGAGGFASEWHCRPGRSASARFCYSRSAMRASPRRVPARAGSAVADSHWIAPATDLRFSGMILGATEATIAASVPELSTCE